MKFYRVNSSIGINVNNRQDIIACLGELGYSIESIDVLRNGLVIGYIGEQGITLGYLKDE